MNSVARRLGIGLLAWGLCAASVSAAKMVVPCSGDEGSRVASTSANPADGQDRWRYPREAMRHRAQGTVMLRVQLDADGAATQVKLAQSSGSSVLDRAALKAAKSARFCKLKAPTESMSGLAHVSVSYTLNVAVARL
ncbi:MAG: energy transducer TonB [Pseudomonadota bacterium]|nr:energy transducer TonB [Pseudomonadota bacterium]